MTTGVLLCLRGEVEESLVAAITEAPGLTVVRRCADTAELLAAALAGLGAVAVIDADFEVDRPLVSRLRAEGTGAIVLCDSDALERHAALGAVAVARGGDLLGAVTALAEGADPGTGRTAERFDGVIGAGWEEPSAPGTTAGTGTAAQAPVGPGSGRDGPAGPGSSGYGSVGSGSGGYESGESRTGGYGSGGPAPVAPGSTAPGATAPVGSVALGDPSGPAGGDEPPGRLLVVWGPAGSPGRTTIAVNLAAELAAAGEPTLLVDADVWGASVAQVLGVLDEFAGLAAAVRAADHGTLDGVSLARLTPFVAERLRVLPGLARPGRWREIGSASLDVLWEQARTLARWVVVDAPVLVPDDDPGFGLGPGRNAVVTSALAAADELVVVGAAEPIGVERLVQALLDLDDVAPAGLGRTVLVNRVRASAAGPRAGASVQEALARFAGVSDAVLVPDDRPMCDRALLAGTSWAETAPRSPAREKLRDVAKDLRARAGVSEGATVGRWGGGRGLRADRVGVARTLRGH